MFEEEEEGATLEEKLVVVIFHVENKQTKNERRKSEQPMKNTIITSKTMTLNKTEDAKYTSICV